MMVSLVIAWAVARDKKNVAVDSGIAPAEAI